ncbi:hypothetical protein AVEN_24406-1 [Araneus ventricosus]|uniref:Uncharacterized protein n=1 Tax=Araneus ventricosus TaxID=182803 RepID=A0A4Y2FCV7_ARAVE|nr:hypothetical protein AVEN_24406-1 [Araneus ventricosus]
MKNEHLFDCDFQHYGVVKRKRSEKGPPDGQISACVVTQVYATPPPTLQDLRRRITDACASVTPAMLHNVQREIQFRV